MLDAILSGIDSFFKDFKENNDTPILLDATATAFGKTFISWSTFIENVC